MKSDKELVEKLRSENSWARKKGKLRIKSGESKKGRSYLKAADFVEELLPKIEEEGYAEHDPALERLASTLEEFVEADNVEDSTGWAEYAVRLRRIKNC